MRVALVLPDLVGGGAERVFLDLARGLLGRGVAVDLVVVRPGGALAGGVPEGARVEVLRVSNVALSVPRLVRYLRRARPAAVVSALSHTNLACVVATRLVRPRPTTVVTQHNHLSTSAAHATLRRDRWMPELVRAVYPFADRVVAVSEGVADDLARRAHLPRGRIDVAYNPVPFEELRAAGRRPPAHPWFAEGAGPVLVAAGRLTAQKDFPTLLHAVAQLPADHRLVILGEGEDRPDLEALARRLGLAGRVDLPGFVADPYPYFAAADVFVLSSRWEGLPTVLIEALAFDVPIVATDCDAGPREILGDGRWGRLVPPGDAAALAAAVQAAVGHRDDDRAAARAPYHLDAVVDRYLDVLNSAGR